MHAVQNLTTLTPLIKEGMRANGRKGMGKEKKVKGKIKNKACHVPDRA